MWAIAWLRAKLGTSPYEGEVGRRPGEVCVRFGNFYKQDISNALPRTPRGAGASIVFVFLMPQNMPRLKKYLATQSLPRAKYLLSYSFPLPGVEAISTVTVPERGTIYIYDLKKLTRAV